MQQNKKPVPRRMQQQQQQQRQPQQPQQPQRGAPQRPSLFRSQRFQQPAPQQHFQQPPPTPPPKPQTAADLKKMIEQYGGILTPENKSFIQELIRHLEKGGDQEALMDLASRMQSALDKGRQGD